MGMQNADNYLRIHDFCIRLHEIGMDPETEPSIVISCAKALIEMESYKREMRGIPRLKAHALGELMPKRSRGSRPIIMRDAKTIEATTTSPEPPKETSKESLSDPDRHRTTTPP
jgi:hypothetical protein